MDETSERTRQVLMEIFDAAVTAVKPGGAIRNSVNIDGDSLCVAGARYDLSRYDRILIVGAGKASAYMALEMERLLGSRVSEGIVNVKYGHGADLGRCVINECGHPVPDQNGIRAARRILDLVATADESTLVVCLVSGGGSALLPLPWPGITLDDLRATNEMLLRSGADIGEINAVRKHLSGIKGGQLAVAAFPADVVTLVISDVIGNRLDVIASGPTVADTSTYADAVAVLERHGIANRVPRPIADHLRAGLAGRVPETPKACDERLSRARNYIISHNGIALKAACSTAAGMGFDARILSSEIRGEAREAAGWLAGQVHAVVEQPRLSDRPLCLISGGETTVTVKGEGKGGRNTEFALAAAVEIHGLEAVSILSCGTDGTDGPTDAAGAVCDGTTIARARRLGISASAHLRNNDSYTFFDRLGDLIVTGPTGTNVMDVQITLILP